MGAHSAKRGPSQHNEIAVGTRGSKTDAARLDHEGQTRTLEALLVRPGRQNVPLLQITIGSSKCPQPFTRHHFVLSQSDR